MSSSSRVIFSKILGSLLGGALGDCLGRPFEGKPAAKIRFSLPDGLWDWTDDTELTLLIGESFAEDGRFVAANAAGQMAGAMRERRLTGLGAATFGALEKLSAGKDWTKSGKKGEYASGNGPATRIASIGLAFDPELESTRQLIHDATWITHQSEEAYSGALAVALAIGGVTGGRCAPGGILPYVLSQLPDSRVKGGLAALGDEKTAISFRHIADEYGTSGFVAESVPLSIYACDRFGGNLPETIKELVEAGGDTDSNASIAGQILGSFSGEPALPREWLEHLVPIPRFHRLSSKLTKIRGSLMRGPRNRSATRPIGPPARRLG